MHPEPVGDRAPVGQGRCSLNVRLAASDPIDQLLGRVTNHRGRRPHRLLDRSQRLRVGDEGQTLGFAADPERDRGGMLAVVCGNPVHRLMAS